MSDVTDTAEVGRRRRGPEDSERVVDDALAGAGGSALTPHLPGGVSGSARFEASKLLLRSTAPTRLR